MAKQAKQAKKRKNTEEDVSEKPQKNITVVDDRHFLEDLVGRYLVEPKYSCVYNYPFKNKVLYFSPSNDFSADIMIKQKPDLVIADVSCGYARMNSIVAEYNERCGIYIPLLVIVRTEDYVSEVMQTFASNPEATFLRYRNDTDTLLATVRKLLEDEKIEPLLRFEKPQIPKNKSGPNASGFGRYRGMRSGRRSQ